MGIADRLTQKLPWAIESRWRYMAFHAFGAMLVFFALKVALRGHSDEWLALVAAIGYTLVEKAIDRIIEPQAWGALLPELGDIVCDTWTAGLVVALVVAADFPAAYALGPLLVWAGIFALVQWWGRP